MTKKKVPADLRTLRKLKRNKATSNLELFSKSGGSIEVNKYFYAH